MKDGKPWVGDEVRDEATNRKAIVTDVRGGSVWGRFGGEPTINDEADGVRFVQPTDPDECDIHASMRQQIGDYLAGTYPYLG